MTRCGPPDAHRSAAMRSPTRRAVGHSVRVELTFQLLRRSNVNRFVCGLAVGVLITACSPTSGRSTSPTSRPAPPTTSTTPVRRGSPALFAACEVGARAYSGVPIAAFKDPSDAREVICWADGHVSKSPPPAPGGKIPPDFNRLVFKTTLDGKHFVLVEAGYRTSLAVTAPTLTACRGIVGNGSRATVADVNVSLRMVGGPAPGLGKPIAGTVVANDPVGRRCTRRVGPSGWVTMTLEPNSYSFTGYSPSYGDSKYTCTAARDAVVDEHPVTSQGQPPVVQVVCAVK